MMKVIKQRFSIMTVTPLIALMTTRILLRVIILRIIILSAIKLSVIMISVMAPVVRWSNPAPNVIMILDREALQKGKAQYS